MMTPVLLLGKTDLASYLPLILLILMAVGFAVGNIAGSMVLGPGRNGATKGMTYESGMNPVGNARKRFNVRFYLIAMVFLVFDVEIIFLYPWASTFPSIAPHVGPRGPHLARPHPLLPLHHTSSPIVYGFRKGVFKFD
jgi:NADH-quinone oxidoreductase subunit A